MIGAASERRRPLQAPTMIVRGIVNDPLKVTCPTEGAIAGVGLDAS